MEPFLGQVCLFGFPFAPVGWAFCQGQLLPISQYTALYSLLGVTYGGDGVTTFALPDLRGRSPLGFNNGQPGPGLQNAYSLGQNGGAENVTLTTSQMPSHNHSLLGTASEADTTTLSGNVLATSNGTLEDGTPTVVNAYSTAGTDGTNSQVAIGVAGGNQPFSVLQPYLAMNYCIALQGTYPSRS